MQVLLARFRLLWYRDHSVSMVLLPFHTQKKPLSASTVSGLPPLPQRVVVLPGTLDQASVFSPIWAPDRVVGFQLYELEVVHCLVLWLTEVPQVGVWQVRSDCATVSVFHQPVDMVLRAVLTSGHLEDVGYAQQGLQCVSVGHHL